jgi:hypothetical protein
MAKDDEDDEPRHEAVYHGTTDGIAHLLAAQKHFDLRQTWFAATEELAAYFAVRTWKKGGGSGKPVVLKVPLYESDLKEWRLAKHVVAIPFSDGDKSELHGKTQLVFSHEGVRLLNRYMFSTSLEILTIKIFG